MKRGLRNLGQSQGSGSGGLFLTLLIGLGFVGGLVLHGVVLGGSTDQLVDPRTVVMRDQITILQRQLAVRDTELLRVKALVTLAPMYQDKPSIKVAFERQPLVGSSPRAPVAGPTFPIAERSHELPDAPATKQKRPGSQEGIVSSDVGAQFRGPISGYLAECTSSPCMKFRSIEAAMNSCGDDCGGFTRYETGDRETFELRAGTEVLPSPGNEASYLKLPFASGGGGGRGASAFVERSATSPAGGGGVGPGGHAMAGGTWSVGNVEGQAQAVVVSGRDPLPTFYRPESDGFSGEGIDDLGSFVAGMPTIYLKVASFRDELCHHTLADAFEKAAHPERIFVGVVEQNAAGDAPCLEVDGMAADACPADVDPLSPSTAALPTLCRWASHIRLYKQHAKDATGPTFARHLGDRLYRGEYFVLQTDAHMTFVTGWDDDIIAQFDASGNEMAVLSTYPTEVEGALDPQGHSKYRTTPVMCATQFTEEGLLRHGSAIEIYPMFGASPILEPFWAAGFSFARGHFAVRVPYDCCTPMLFQGEEIDIAIRAWTWGYDLYTPHHSVAFHPYNRKSKPPMFWENAQAHKGDARRSAVRVQALTSLGEPAEGTFDATDRDLYGLGHKRDSEVFFRMLGLDRKAQRLSKDLCSWSTSGNMHRELTALMRKDLKGIDYGNYHG